MYIFLYVCICKFVCVCRYVCIYVCMYIYVYMYVYVNLCVCVCMCILRYLNSLPVTVCKCVTDTSHLVPQFTALHPNSSVT